MSVSTVAQTPSGFGNLILYGLAEPSGFTEANVVQPISFFPQTLGWLLLVIVLFVYLSVRIIKGVRLWLDNRYRRAFIERLPNIETINFEYDLYHLMVQARALANRTNANYQADLFAAPWLIAMDGQCADASRLHSELGMQWMQVLTYQRKKPLCSNQRMQLRQDCQRWLLDHDNQQFSLTSKHGA